MPNLSASQYAFCNERENGGLSRRERVVAADYQEVNKTARKLDKTCGRFIHYETSFLLAVKRFQ
jgi:hypothetical protein